MIWNDCTEPTTDTPDISKARMARQKFLILILISQQIKDKRKWERGSSYCALSAPEKEAAGMWQERRRE